MYENANTRLSYDIAYRFGTSSDSAYAQMMQTFFAKFTPLYENASEPKDVAKVILRAVTSDNSDSTYLVGNDAANLMKSKKNMSDKKVNIHFFLDGLSLFCKYARVAEYDLETDGRNYTITMHHELGEKWSNWLGHVISQGIETDLGLNPELDFSKSSIIIKFLVH